MTNAHAEYPVTLAGAPDTKQNNTAKMKMAILSFVFATTRLARNNRLS
jgi:hypothetical protein